MSADTRNVRPDCADGVTFARVWMAGELDMGDHFWPSIYPGIVVGLLYGLYAGGVVNAIVGSIAGFFGVLAAFVMFVIGDVPTMAVMLVLWNH